MSAFIGVPLAFDLGQLVAGVSPEDFAIYVDGYATRILNIYENGVGSVQINAGTRTTTTHNVELLSVSTSILGTFIAGIGKAGIGGASALFADSVVIAAPSGDILVTTPGYIRLVCGQFGAFGVPQVSQPTVSGSQPLQSTIAALVALGWVADGLTGSADPLRTCYFADSIGCYPYQYPNAITNTWPDLVDSLFAEPLRTTTNQSISGASLSTLTPQFILTTAPRVAVVARGINDIFGGASLVTLQTEIQALADLVTAANAFCVVPTVLPSTTLNVAKEAVRVAYNAWLLATLALQAGVVVPDPASDPDLDDPTNLVFYDADGTHPTFAGQTVYAGIMYASMSVL